MTVIVGIDPGQKGALAVLVNGELTIWDLQDCYKPTGSFNSLDPLLFEQLVDSAIPYEYEPEDVVVFCEESLVIGGGAKASGMSMRSIYDSRGVMRSEFCKRENEVHYIVPHKWKRHFGLLKTKEDDPKKMKEKSVNKACEVFPLDKDFFTRPKRGGGVMMLDGRAEAALIAQYGSLIIRKS